MRKFVILGLMLVTAATTLIMFSTNVSTMAQSCDASYPDVCIASPPPDLDCGDITDKDFKVESSDPHGFDRDGNGIGCES
jgi:hypothetical protein